MTVDSALVRHEINRIMNIQRNDDHVITTARAKIETLDALGLITFEQEIMLSEYIDKLERSR